MVGRACAKSPPLGVGRNPESFADGNVSFASARMDSRLRGNDGLGEGMTVEHRE